MTHAGEWWGRRRRGGGEKGEARRRWWGGDREERHNNPFRVGGLWGLWRLLGRLAPRPIPSPKHSLLSPVIGFLHISSPFSHVPSASHPFSLSLLSTFILPFTPPIVSHSPTPPSPHLSSPSSPLSPNATHFHFFSSLALFSPFPLRPSNPLHRRANCQYLKVFFLKVYPLMVVFCVFNES